MNGQIQAVVEFPDGYTQTVQIPYWGTKKNIKDEAQRLRKEVEDRETKKIQRSDLVDI